MLYKMGFHHDSSKGRPPPGKLAPQADPTWPSNPGAQHSATTNRGARQQRVSQQSQPVDPQDLARRLNLVLAQQNYAAEKARRASAGALGSDAAAAPGSGVKPSLNPQHANDPMASHPGFLVQSRDPASQQQRRSSKLHLITREAGEREARAMHNLQVKQQKQQERERELKWQQEEQERQEQLALQQQELQRQQALKAQQEAAAAAAAAAGDSNTPGISGNHYIPQQAALQFEKTATNEQMRESKPGPHKLSKKTIKAVLRGNETREANPEGSPGKKDRKNKSGKPGSKDESSRAPGVTSPQSASGNQGGASSRGGSAGDGGPHAPPPTQPMPTEEPPQRLPTKAASSPWQSHKAGRRSRDLSGFPLFNWGHSNRHSTVEPPSTTDAAAINAPIAAANPSSSPIARRRTVRRSSTGDLLTRPDRTEAEWAAARRSAYDAFTLEPLSINDSAIADGDEHEPPVATEAAMDRRNSAAAPRSTLAGPLINEHRIDWTQSDEPRKSSGAGVRGLKKAESIWRLGGRLHVGGRKGTADTEPAGDADSAAAAGGEMDDKGESGQALERPVSYPPPKGKSGGFFSRFKR